MQILIWSLNICPLLEKVNVCYLRKIFPSHNHGLIPNSKVSILIIMKFMANQMKFILFEEENAMLK